MAHPAGGPAFLRRLFTAAGWKVRPVPGGWLAQREGAGGTTVMYLEGDIPAGFQQHFPHPPGDVRVLLGHEPAPHDRDRIEIVGARVVPPEDVPEVVAELLGGAGGGSVRGPPDAAPSQEASSEGPDPSRPARSLPLARAAPGPDREAPRDPSGRVTPADARSTDDGTPPPSSDEPREPEPMYREEFEEPFPQDPVPFPPQVFEGDRIVRPRLHLSDLFQMALGRWRGGSPRLVLVPFYLFAYALAEDGEDAGAPPRLVAVPAVGGTPQFWPPGEREIVAALPDPHHRLDPRIEREAARALALTAVGERHAQLEESAERVQGMLVIEERRRIRDPREVRIGPPAMIWVPYWVVEAWNGREVLDAVTGLPSHIVLDPGLPGE